MEESVSRVLAQLSWSRNVTSVRAVINSMWALTFALSHRHQHIWLICTPIHQYVASSLRTTGCSTTIVAKCFLFFFCKHSAHRSHLPCYLCEQGAAFSSCSASFQTDAAVISVFTVWLQLFPNWNDPAALHFSAKESCKLRDFWALGAVCQAALINSELSDQHHVFLTSSAPLQLTWTSGEDALSVASSHSLSHACLIPLQFVAR